MIIKPGTLCRFRKEIFASPSFVGDHEIWMYINSEVKKTKNIGNAEVSLFKHSFLNLDGEKEFFTSRLPFNRWAKRYLKVVEKE